MCIGSYADISVHAPTRGATSNSLSFSIFSVFQSTLPREERLLQQYLSHFQLLFQSTLPREERPLQHQLGLHRRIFQSTLPREERLKLIRHPLIRIVISIHAPTRGATFPVRRAPMIKIFQSTLPREERLIPLLNMTSLSLFQSTLPREERHSHLA